MFSVHVSVALEVLHAVAVDLLQNLVCLEIESSRLAKMDWGFLDHKFV